MGILMLTNLAFKLTFLMMKIDTGKRNLSDKNSTEVNSTKFNSKNEHYLRISN